MRRQHLLLTLGCLAIQASAQSESHREVFGSFSAELPAVWRRMTPDDAFEHGDKLPFELRSVVPGKYDVVGAVDAWIQGEFDGVALIITTQTGEIPLEPASIDRIREHWEENPGDGPRREFVSGEVGAIGKDRHPAVICRMRTEPDPRFGRGSSTEYYVPTNGQLLILGFHSWEDSGEKARALFESIVETASFPRPPKGAEAIGDRLGRALTVGALVGLFLVVLRMMRRRPTPTSGQSPNSDS